MIMNDVVEDTGLRDLLADNTVGAFDSLACTEIAT